MKNEHIILPMLDRFPQHVQHTIIWLRNMIWERYPESNELIYEKANALVIGWDLPTSLGIFS